MNGFKHLGLLASLLSFVACAPGTPEVPLPTVQETQQRIEALKAERVKLQDTLRGSLSDDAKLEGAPDAGVLIGLPSALVESIVSEALTGPLRNVRLSLKDVVKVELKDDIKARILFRNTTLGRYELAVRVRSVAATMMPGVPELAFGSNRIAIDLPVRVQSGEVKADLAFKWDGRKMAGVVCGDLSAEHQIRAAVPPVNVRLRGRFNVEARGEQLLVKPVIAPITLAFKVEPEQGTWDFIDTLIESRNAVCEAALRKAAVGQRIKDLVAKGFQVKLATNWLRVMTLPASFRDTFEVQGTSAGLAIMPTGVSITKSRIWYGAQVTVKTRPSASVTAPAPPR